MGKKILAIVAKLLATMPIHVCVFFFFVVFNLFPIPLNNWHCEQKNTVSVNFISRYYSQKTRKKEIERQLNIYLTLFYFPKK